jgi:hypothetical protein
MNPPCKESKPLWKLRTGKNIWADRSKPLLKIKACLQGTTKPPTKSEVVSKFIILCISIKSPIKIQYPASISQIAAKLSQPENIRKNRTPQASSGRPDQEPVF